MAVNVVVEEQGSEAGNTLHQLADGKPYVFLVGKLEGEGEERHLVLDMMTNAGPNDTDGIRYLLEAAYANLPE